MAYVGRSISKSLTVSKNQRQRRGYDLQSAKIFTKAGKALTDLTSFTCPLCKFVLRNPRQLLECGCRYCEPCLDTLLEGLEPKCVEDDQPIAKDETRLDKGCLREINSLKVECPGTERGCTWIGGVVQFEEHADECDLVHVKCECGEIMMRSSLKSHELQCPNLADSRSFDSRSSGFESLHMCQYPECLFSGDENALNSHALDHIHSLVSLLNTLQANVKHLKNDYILMQQSEKRLQKQVSNHEKDLAQLREDVQAIPTLRQEIDQLKKEVTEIRKIESDSAYPKRRGEDTSPHWGSSSSLGSSFFGSRDSSRSILPRVDQLEKDIRFLKPAVEEAKAEIGLQRSKLAGYIDTVQTMQENVTRHAVTMEEIKLRQDILDVKTVHGVFIWKIPEIARRFRDAQEKRTISLYSPPFHTSPHGYRACIRAYLNGDGSGKGSHISVFFVLMKSEHDNLLKWPFERPVTFELVNQENRPQSISETFMPEKRSASFQQPKSEMNVASGFPQFASHSVLTQHQFVAGDAIYIRCKIDTTGLTLE